MILKFHNLDFISTLFIKNMKINRTCKRYSNRSNEKWVLAACLEKETFIV